MSPDQQKTEQTAETRTARGHRHKVLVVDDETAAGKAIGRVLAREEIAFTYVASGEEGLAEVKAASPPFSLILSDQRMPGIQGTEFLSKAKEVAPDTIRYLITGYSEMDFILNAVNKGAVQHFIAKPWDVEELRQVIRRGIAQYEKHLDSEKLFALAKKQNAKLYDLNCELVRQTKALETQRENLTREIQEISAQLNQEDSGSDTDPARVIDALADWLQQEGSDDLNTLKRHALTRLYEAFTDLALRNGLEMPGIRLGPGPSGGDHA